MIDRPTALQTQHGGQAGRDNGWLAFVAKQPPQWFEPFGGTLFEVQDLISKHAESSENTNARIQR